MMELLAAETEKRAKLEWILFKGFGAIRKYISFKIAPSAYVKGYFKKL